MKRNIIITTLLGQLMTLNVLAQTLNNPTNIGTKSASFTYTHTANTANTSNSYTLRNPNDVTYQFTLTQPMDVTISHCGSSLSDTYLNLLDVSKVRIASNDDYSGIDKCSSSYHSYIKKALPSGTYYVVSEGYSQNGSITTTITGNAPLNINVGTKSASFTYTHTANTANTANSYTLRSQNDVTYQFTLTQSMDVTISHCGSSLSDTYLHLLDASRERIEFNDNYSEKGSCSSSYHSYIKKALPAGTYYAVSEGYSQNGSITTTITGNAPLNINLGTKSASFTYTHTANTANTANSYTAYGRNDATYQFTITQPMDMVLSHCGSALSITYIILLDASGERIEFNDGYNGYSGTGKCPNSPNSQHAYLQMALPPGTYYAVSEGWCDDGNITINITGTLRAPIQPLNINIGTKKESFTYTHTANTASATNSHTRRIQNDAIYQFTLSQPMDMLISHCGSELQNTYLQLLNASKTMIAYNDDYTGIDKCPSTHNACLHIDLPEGTYYVVSEGSYHNGNITTNIQGTVIFNGEVQASFAQSHVKRRYYTDAAGSSYRDIIQYYDGMGFPIQEVQAGITPNHADLVGFQTYDGLGRESNTWLPVPVNNNNGAFVEFENFKSKSAGVYNNTNCNSSSDSKPYTKTIYESYPNMVWQYGPGQGWHDNIKPVKTEYLTNNSDYPCVYYSHILSGNGVKHNGNYADNELFVTKTTDEGGNISYEFKDKQDRVILQRQMKGTEKHDTYYVYDDFNNLRHILPPLAVDKFTSGSLREINTELREYAYSYKYDDHNRCITQKRPGTDFTYYIYDKADRPIFTQDGEQRQKGIWMFSIPDIFGRTVLTGTCKNEMSYTSDPLKTVVVTASRTNSTNSLYGYSLNGLSLTSPQILTVNYYDDYNFMGKNNIPASSDADFKYESFPEYGQRYTASPKGFITGTVTAYNALPLPNKTGVWGGSTMTVYENNDPFPESMAYLASVMYYDYRGRLVQSKSQNQRGKVEKEYLAYNFTDQPVKKKLVHPGITEIYDYEYDHAGRLINETHKYNNKASVVLAHNTYDELGRLKTTQAANLPNLLTSYAYNIRSWTSSITNDLFSENLLYDYNGNITNISSSQKNSTSGTALNRVQTFQYDQLSRLIAASCSGGNQNHSASYNYDKQGNITNLMRYGQLSAGVYGLIDNLSFSYTGNQLKTVNDMGEDCYLSTSADFKDYANVSSEYTHNSNGSIIKDLNKGIQSITYNHLNLPVYVTIDNPDVRGSSAYSYSARGEKLRVIHRWESNLYDKPPVMSDINDYFGNVDYGKSRVFFENGYTSGELYFFYIRDHLGSVRIAVNIRGAVNQSTEYYPFGMPYSEGIGQNLQPFKYNGQEFETMNGLNLYDYEFRRHDPSTGRFLTIDPLAEKYPWISPYAYCNNNPVRYIDPTGMDYWSTNDPAQIRSFFNALGSRTGQFDFSGWQHATDAEFT
ncbi:MAG: RHS repeat-associated core domain-containing protein, partial [Dysgonamonadaceae bacterium]|nr:RHS repeat-associated core domain-containing protein [Dysgonamonadaceae bacterium]